MISVDEARKIIIENCSERSSKTVSLELASGATLAADIYSTTDIPPFHQSAVDGYALAFDEWKMQNQLTVSGVIPAGSNSIPTRLTNHAIRIFTGAPVPEAYDTVVMQEKVKVTDGQLVIEDSELSKGNAIRLKGSEIKSATLALEKGTYLSPAAIGFLASIGIAEVLVHDTISVYILVTGNELQHPGTPLSPGQIYESNSYALVAALKQLRITDIQVERVQDSLEELSLKIKSALIASDIILITGGVSVGDYDYVLQATEKNGIHKLFHRIKQKPGKPMYFGKKDKTLVFGLPGNPASVLSCFYEYVIPVLHFLNNSIQDLKKLNVPIDKSYQKKAGLTHFLKGYYDNSIVQLLDAQESFRLSSFAKANCLICIPEETTLVQKGDLVEIHPVY
jgi:molybdopterin molybdotransferase